MSSHVHKDCIFTTHALERLRQRSISEYAVADTVLYPDKKFTDGKNTKFIKTIAGRKHQVIAHWKPAEQKWLIVSAWVRGENDSDPLYAQLLLAPFRLIWWLLKRFVFVRILLFIFIVFAALFLWYTRTYAQLYAYELNSSPLTSIARNTPDFLEESDYPRSFFLNSLARTTIGIKDTDSETDKIYKIAHYLDTTFSHLRERPVTVSAYDAAPETLFMLLKNEKTGVYCTHFARMFVALAQETGLVSRLVHISRGEQQHTVAEVFLNDEKQWVTVDVQYNTALFLNVETKEPLNVTEIAEHVRGKKKVLSIKSDVSSLQENIQSFPSGYGKYFGSGATLSYEQKHQPVVLDVFFSKKYLKNTLPLFIELMSEKISILR